MISDFESYKNTITSFNAPMIYEDKKEIKKILKAAKLYKFSKEDFQNHVNKIARSKILALRVKLLEEENQLFDQYESETEEFKTKIEEIEDKLKFYNTALEEIEKE
jgi:hypothetical protein